MITKSKNIARGVRISYIEAKKFKTNYLTFNIIAPLSKETVHFNAMIPSILMRGSKEYPSTQALNKQCQFLYSTDISIKNLTVGEYQVFGVCANTLSNRFVNDMDLNGEVVNFICEIIFNPYLVNGAFDEEFVKEKKKNLIDAIKAKINDKGSYAMNRLLEEMCKDEVLSISRLGRIEDVETITPTSLYDAYVYALKSYPIEIHFVGNGDFDKIAEEFAKAFSKIEREPIELPTIPIVTEVKEVKEIVDTENVSQGKLVLGFRTCYSPEEQNYHVMQLFNEIYGCSPTAKLFLNVREKMSLCYYCHSRVAQRGGIMTVSSGIEAKNKEIAQQAIIDQLEQIQRGEISCEELESAKKSIKNGYRQIYDSLSSMSAWVFNRGLSGSYTTPEEECEKIDGVTVSEIMELAKRFKLDTVYFLKGLEGEDENV